MSTKTSVESLSLSIVIPHYNDNARCLTLVERLDQELTLRECWECIIVDNGSDSLLSLPTNSSAQLLACEQPGSYAARNMGVGRSQGDYLIFTDSDCLPDQLWLNAIESFYRDGSNDKTILAGKVVVFPAKVGAETIYEAYDCLNGLDQQRYVKNGTAITANLVFSRKIFDDVGGFDSARFSGGDADFVKRAVDKGYELIYCPEAVVYHPARSSFSEIDRKSRRVVGGQLRQGALHKRALYFLKNVFPPVLEAKRIMSKKGSPRLKVKALIFLFPLWYMRLKNTLGAVFSSSYVAR